MDRITEALRAQIILATIFSAVTENHDTLWRTLAKRQSAAQVIALNIKQPAQSTINSTGFLSQPNTETGPRGPDAG